VQVKTTKAPNGKQVIKEAPNTSVLLRWSCCYCWWLWLFCDVSYYTISCTVQLLLSY